MFTINTDKTIKMNRGDDVQFPLFLNNGTRAKPIRYEFEPDDGCEIYFYLLPLHGSYEDYIIKKTYSTSGVIVTYIPGSEPTTKLVNSIINDYGDVVITLDSEDTVDLCPGQYVYVVRAKVLTEKINSTNIVKNSEYTELQVTNKYDFYLLDDDINRAG